MRWLGRRSPSNSVVVMIRFFSANDSGLLRRILGLTLPITLGAMVQTSYHLVNAFWVGRLDADAVAVISLSLPINMLLISIGSGLALATSIIIAQLFGKQDVKQINHVVVQSLWAIVVLSLLVAVIGYWLAPLLPSLFGVNEAISEQLINYLRISFFSLLFVMLCSLYQSVFRAMGEVKAPLRLILASVVINGLLDPWFIFGWGWVPAMGVEGAAYATLITQGLTALAGLQLMLQPRFGLRLRTVAWRLDIAAITRLFRLGIPASIEQSTQALSVSVMNMLVAPFGTLTLAAFGITFRIFTLLMIPSFCLSIAVSILVGQALGAANEQQCYRITRVASLLGITIMAVVTLLFLLFAQPIVAIFAPNDPAVIAKGAVIIQVLAITLPFTVLQLVLSGTLRGAGATMASMTLTLISTWIVQLPLVYWLSRDSWFGEAGLWWASVVTSLLTTVLI